MDIEAIVKKHCTRWQDMGPLRVSEAIRAALTEADAAMAMEHNLKMLQVEATVRNLVERIRQLEAEIAESERKLEVSGYAWSQMGEQLNALRGELAESRERIRQLEGALEIIAGRKQCIDNTMGNADVAMAVLAAAPAKEGE